MGALKTFIGNTASGVLVAALTAGAFPEMAIEMKLLAFGLVTIPLALALGGACLALYGLYVVIHLVDSVATHLEFFDIGG